jgi:hypothetical protein
VSGKWVLFFIIMFFFRHLNVFENVAFESSAS